MTQAYETIELAIDPRGLARLVLNRPDKHNALNAVMIRELTDAAKRLSGDTRVRAVVLSARGKSFCAGGDLAWMREQFVASRSSRIAEATRLAAMLQRLDELPKLVIAIIEGAAFGGGVGLVSVCDIVLASPTSKFALTETRLGLIPAIIAPFLIRRVGPGNARRLALNANPFGAGEARAIGLVSEIHESDKLNEAVERQIELALACAPGAIAETKQLLRGVATGSVSQPATAEALALRWESEEARRGIESFLNRTRPPWAP
ncbi:MAG: enoyl-CoA hydratase-related protein [Aestuariivirga sp.]